jgi:error-prone DNA polymerase
MMDRFIRCHTGREKVSYLHPLMGKLLGDTYGIMIYQEDVIKVAHHLAGFSFSEADLLRRGMSKKRHWTDLNEYRQRFIEGAISRGIEREIAGQIWKQIDSFSGYSFCKAHSASYAVISFRSAYLRNRFPAEFMASVLSNSGGFYNTSAYLEEARRMGLKIVPPSINLSREAYTGKNGELTVGLMQIRGLSRATIKSIIEERRAKGPFKTLEDVLLRTGMSLTDAEILIKVGTMDEFGHTRPGLLWKLREVYDSIEKIRGRIEEAAETIFDECGGLTTIPVPDLKDHPWKEKLRLEMELLGMAVSAHPMRMVREEVDSIRHVNASDLSRHAGRRVTVVGRIVTAKRTVTHKGEFMKFITLEDETGLVEVVLFPGAYRSYGHLLICRGPFAVTGKVENDSGGITLTAAHIKLVELHRRESGAGKVGTISA